MRIWFGTGALFSALLCVSGVASAQERTAAPFDSTKADTSTYNNIGGGMEGMKPEEQMGTSGFFLGIIGMLGGAAIGSQIGQAECPAREVDKHCTSRHAYTGALVAGTVMVPIGVHLANKQRKNLPLSLAISALTGTALYFGMKAIPGEPVAIAPFLAAPLQVVTSVKLEGK